MKSKNQIRFLNKLQPIEFQCTLSRISIYFSNRIIILSQHAFFLRKKIFFVFFLLISVNVVDGEMLQITKVSRLHMAAYLCVASNGVPPSISKRVLLRVQCKSTHIYIYITCISDGNINHKCFAIEFLSTSNMLFYSYLYLTFIHIFFALVPFAFIIGVCECVLCFVCRVFESFHKFLSIIQMPGYFTCAICKARFFCTLSLLFVVSFQIHEKFTICCMHACSLTRLPYDVSHHIETISDVSAAHIHS